MSENSHAPEEHHAQAEPDRTNVALLGSLVAITAAVLVVTVWGLDVYFTRQTEALRYEKVLSVPNPELIQLRQQEQTWLTSYAVVDREKGVYSIPVDQAMKLFVQEASARAQAGEPQRVGPPVAPPGAAPAPADGAAPAPADGAAPAPAPAAQGGR